MALWWCLVDCCMLVYVVVVDCCMCEFGVTSQEVQTKSPLR
jgi:hypothetical protein